MSHLLSIHCYMVYLQSNRICRAFICVVFFLSSLKRRPVNTNIRLFISDKESQKFNRVVVSGRSPGG